MDLVAAEQTDRPAPHSIRATLSAAPVLAVSETTTKEDVRDTWRGFGAIDEYTIGGRRFLGTSPWELHPYNDELLYVLDGELEVTLLTEPTSSSTVVGPGSLFVIPKGTWHRQSAREVVTSWGVTASQHDVISFADDPRHP